MRILRFGFIDVTTLIGEFITNEFYREFGSSLELADEEVLDIMVDTQNKMVSYAITLPFDSCGLEELGDFTDYTYVSYIHSFRSGCGKIMLSAYGRVILYSLKDMTDYYEYIGFKRIKPRRGYYMGCGTTTEIEIEESDLMSDMDDIIIPKEIEW